MSFLEFTGENKEEDNNYLFEIKGKNNKLKYKKYDERIDIPNLIVDMNLYQVFVKNPEITKNMLNNVIYPDSNEIIDLEYISTDLLSDIIFEFRQNGYGKFYFLDSLKADILCKCKLKNEKAQNQAKNEIIDEEEPIFDEINIGVKDNNEFEKELENYFDENYSEDEKEKKNKNNKKDKKGNKDKKEKYKKNEEKTIIIDLQMHIDYNTYNNPIYIEYAKRLNDKYQTKIIVLSLVYRGLQNPQKNKGFVISLDQKDLNDYKGIKTFDDYIIYQIDLDYYFHLISKKNEKLWILDESQIMNDYSKEWIKYLTLPTWCKSSKKEYYYGFPPINKDFFKNEYVYEAFKILSKQDELIYFKYAERQESQTNFIKSLIKLYNEIKRKDKEIKDKEEEIKAKNKEIKDKNKEIRNKCKKIKDKNKEINKINNEIQKLEIRNSKSKSNDKKNKTNNKKSKKPGKIRKTSVMYISSEDDN